jgi:sRNA-binding regulator protein Hfq
MTDKTKTTDKPAVPAARPVPPPSHWGLDGEKVLEKLQNCLVQVQMQDGTSIEGKLVGYTNYTLTLRRADGVTLVNKGALATLRPSKPAPVEGEHGTT